MAHDIEEANQAFVDFIDTVTDGEWIHITAREGWTVGVVAHHIAWGHERAAEWIESIRRGQSIPGSRQEHDASNAAMASEVAGIDKAQVLVLAYRNLEKLAMILRSLSEDELTNSVSFGPAGGYPLSISDLGRRHLDGHLASIRETLGR